MGYECDEHTWTCPSAHTKYFAASGGICVTNVITAVQLQDDRIKLLLKRGDGGEWMTRKTLVTKWSGGDDMKVGGWQGKTQTVRGHYRGGKQRGWIWEREDESDNKRDGVAEKGAREKKWIEKIIKRRRRKQNIKRERMPSYPKAILLAGWQWVTFKVKITPRSSLAARCSDWASTAQQEHQLQVYKERQLTLYILSLYHTSPSFPGLKTDFLHCPVSRNFLLLYKKW